MTLMFNGQAAIVGSIGIELPLTCYLVLADIPVRCISPQTFDAIAEVNSW